MASLRPIPRTTPPVAIAAAPVAARRRVAWVLPVAVLALMALGACNKDKEQTLFDGVAFKTRAVKENKDLSVFVVTVSPVSASLDGAREAGRYQGTRYCIENYGTSTIHWTVGPDTDPASLVIDKDTAIFKGKCKP